MLASRDLARVRDELAERLAPPRVAYALQRHHLTAEALPSRVPAAARAATVSPPTHASARARRLRTGIRCRSTRAN